MTLKTWRMETNKDFPLVSADKHMTLDVAVKKIVENKLHRLPIVEEQDNLILGMVNIEDLFSFFFENFIGEEQLFDNQFSEVGIGTKDIITIPT
jgi:CBS domain-containing protein